MRMVGDHAERIQVLDYGTTIAMGPPDEVLSNQQVTNAYIDVEG